MADYLSTMKEIAEKLDESIDRISLEPLALVKDEGSYRHQTIPLIASGCIQYWDTYHLCAWLEQSGNTDKGRDGSPCEWRHPLTGNCLKLTERKYIEHYKKCLEWEKVTFLKYPDEAEIMQNFKEKDGYLTSVDLLTARAILSPRNFADHFKDYPPITGEIKYERTQAIEELGKALPGTWLLRHSSLNRPSHADHIKLNEKLGLRFYAISYKKTAYEGKIRNNYNRGHNSNPNDNNDDNNGDNDEGINHLLIMHQPGKGWAQISDIEYQYNTICPVGSARYHVCFLDILITSIRNLKLRFNDCISQYAATYEARLEARLQTM